MGSMFNGWAVGGTWWACSILPWNVDIGGQRNGDGDANKQKSITNESID